MRSPWEHAGSREPGPGRNAPGPYWAGGLLPAARPTLGWVFPRRLLEASGQFPGGICEPLGAAVDVRLQPFLSAMPTHLQYAVQGATPCTLHDAACRWPALALKDRAPRHARVCVYIYSFLFWWGFGFSVLLCVLIGPHYLSVTGEENSPQGGFRG